MQPGERNQCDDWSTTWTSHKFWEVQVDGSEVTTRWGRIGTKGQGKTKTHPDPESAQRDADKQAEKKLAKGYVELLAADAREGAQEVSDTTASSVTGGIQKSRNPQTGIVEEVVRSVPSASSAGPRPGGRKRTRFDHPIWGAVRALPVGQGVRCVRWRGVIAQEGPPGGLVRRAVMGGHVGSVDLEIEIAFDEAGEPELRVDAERFPAAGDVVEVLLELYAECRRLTDELADVDPEIWRAALEARQQQVRRWVATGRAGRRPGPSLWAQTYVGELRDHRRRQAAEPTFSEVGRVPLGPGEVLEAPADRLTTPEGVVLGLAPRRREEAVALHARVSAVGSDRLWAVLVDLAYWSWLRERHGSTARATSSSDRGRPPADADNVVALLQARLGDAVCEARRVPPLRGPAVVVVYEGALDRLPQVLLHPGPEVHFSAEEAGALWTRWHARHEARPFAAGADVLEFQVPQPVPPESSAALAAEHRCYGAVTLDGDRWRFRW